jgi:septal ring factor EnvC (AmiA/AmiB activator)
MSKLQKVSRYLLISSFIAACFMAGCTKRPTEEQLTKLEETRAAIESAERKLAELREERMSLESQLSQKQAELREHEAERDDLREKMAARESGGE